jgi:uncharacterized DUF497 family protein
MDFEFDPTKSATNKVKHGIDFVEAQKLCEDRSSPCSSKNRGRRTVHVDWQVGPETLVGHIH